MEKLHRECKRFSVKVGWQWRTFLSGDPALWEGVICLGIGVSLPPDAKRDTSITNSDRFLCGDVLSAGQQAYEF